MNENNPLQNFITNPLTAGIPNVTGVNAPTVQQFSEQTAAQAVSQQQSEQLMSPIDLSSIAQASQAPTAFEAVQNTQPGLQNFGFNPDPLATPVVPGTDIGTILPPVQQQQFATANIPLITGVGEGVADLTRRIAQQSINTNQDDSSIGPTANSLGQELSNNIGQGLQGVTDVGNQAANIGSKIVSSAGDIVFGIAKLVPKIAIGGTNFLGDVVQSSAASVAINKTASDVLQAQIGTNFPIKLNIEKLDETAKILKSASETQNALYSDLLKGNITNEEYNAQTLANQNATKLSYASSLKDLFNNSPIKYNGKLLTELTPEEFSKYYDTYQQAIKPINDQLKNGFADRQKINDTTTAFLDNKNIKDIENERKVDAEAEAQNQTKANERIAKVIGPQIRLEDNPLLTSKRFSEEINNAATYFSNQLKENNQNLESTIKEYKNMYGEVLPADIQAKVNFLTKATEDQNQRIENWASTRAKALNQEKDPERARIVAERDIQDKYGVPLSVYIGGEEGKTNLDKMNQLFNKYLGMDRFSKFGSDLLQGDLVGGLKILDNVLDIAGQETAVAFNQQQRLNTERLAQLFRGNNPLDLSTANQGALLDSNRLKNISLDTEPVSEIQKFLNTTYDVDDNIANAIFQLAGFGGIGNLVKLVQLGKLPTSTVLQSLKNAPSLTKAFVEFGYGFGQSGLIQAGINQRRNDTDRILDTMFGLAFDLAQPLFSLANFNLAKNFGYGVQDFSFKKLDNPEKIKIWYEYNFPGQKPTEADIQGFSNLLKVVDNKFSQMPKEQQDGVIKTFYGYNKLRSLLGSNDNGIGLAPLDYQYQKLKSEGKISGAKDLLIQQIAKELGDNTSGIDMLAKDIPGTGKVKFGDNISSFGGEFPEPVISRIVPDQYSVLQIGQDKVFDLNRATKIVENAKNAGIKTIDGADITKVEDIFIPLEKGEYKGLSALKLNDSALGIIDNGIANNKAIDTILQTSEVRRTTQDDFINIIEESGVNLVNKDKIIETNAFDKLQKYVNKISEDFIIC